MLLPSKEEKGGEGCMFILVYGEKVKYQESNIKIIKL